MPTNIIPPAIPALSPSNFLITGPADSDPLLAASVNNAFTPLAERSKISFVGLRGSRAAYHEFVCDDGVTWVWSGFAAARSTTRSFGKVFTTDTINSLGLGALAANTIYYIYAQDSGGVWQVVGSTTPPDTFRRYQLGNEDLVFLSMFITDSGAAIVPWSQWDTHYSFTNPVPVLTAGGATTWATVALNNIVPPWVELVTADVRVVNSDSTDIKFIQLSKDGVTAHRQLFCGVPPATKSMFGNAEMTIPCASGGVGFKYQLSGGSCTSTIRLTGMFL